MGSDSAIWIANSGPGEEIYSTRKFPACLWKATCQKLDSPCYPPCTLLAQLASLSRSCQRFDALLPAKQITKFPKSWLCCCEFSTGVLYVPAVSQPGHQGGTRLCEPRIWPSDDLKLNRRGFGSDCFTRHESSRLGHPTKMVAADGADGNDSDDKDEEMSGAVAVYLLFAENIANPIVRMSWSTQSSAFQRIPAHFLDLSCALINEKLLSLQPAWFGSCMILSKPFLLQRMWTRSAAAKTPKWWFQGRLK